MEEIVRSRRADDDPVTAVHAARRQLFAARTARLALRREPEVPPSELRGQGVLARALRKITGTPGLVEAHGILDLSQPGAAYDHGQFAVTEIGAGIWGGPSGRSLEALPVDPDCRPGPLWFLGAVEFLNGAVEDGHEEVAGSPCRRLRVSADLSVSADLRSAETSASMGWMPDLVPDLSTVPVTVWIDQEHVRGIRVSGRGQVYTLELWDIGVDVTGFDWTRLSTFRTSVREDARARANTV